MNIEEIILIGDTTPEQMREGIGSEVLKIRGGEPLPDHAAATSYAIAHHSGSPRGSKIAIQYKGWGGALTWSISWTYDHG